MVGTQPPFSLEGVGTEGRLLAPETHVLVGEHLIFDKCAPDLHVVLPLQVHEDVFLFLVHLVAHARQRMEGSSGDDGVVFTASPLWCDTLEDT